MSWEDLPQPIVRRIAGYLSQSDYYAVGGVVSVCRSWHASFRNELSQIPNVLQDPNIHKIGVVTLDNNEKPDSIEKGNTPPCAQKGKQAVCGDTHECQQALHANIKRQEQLQNSLKRMLNQFEGLKHIRIAVTCAVQFQGGGQKAHISVKVMGVPIKQAIDALQQLQSLRSIQVYIHMNEPVLECSSFTKLSTLGEYEVKVPDDAAHDQIPHTQCEYYSPEYSQGPVTRSQVQRQRSQEAQESSQQTAGSNGRVESGVQTGSGTQTGSGIETGSGNGSGGVSTGAHAGRVNSRSQQNRQYGQVQQRRMFPDDVWQQFGVTQSYPGLAQPAGDWDDESVTDDGDWDDGGDSQVVNDDSDWGSSSGGGLLNDSHSLQVSDQQINNEARNVVSQPIAPHNASASVEATDGVDATDVVQAQSLNYEAQGIQGIQVIQSIQVVQGMDGDGDGGELHGSVWGSAGNISNGNSSTSNGTSSTSSGSWVEEEVTRSPISPKSNNFVFNGPVTRPYSFRCVDPEQCAPDRYGDVNYDKQPRLLSIIMQDIENQLTNMLQSKGEQSTLCEPGSSTAPRGSSTGMGTGQYSVNFQIIHYPMELTAYLRSDYGYLPPIMNSASVRGLMWENLDMSQVRQLIQDQKPVIAGEINHQSIEIALYNIFINYFGQNNIKNAGCCSITHATASCDVVLSSPILLASLLHNAPISQLHIASPLALLAMVPHQYTLIQKGVKWDKVKVDAGSLAWLRLQNIATKKYMPHNDKTLRNQSILARLAPWLQARAPISSTLTTLVVSLSSFSVFTLKATEAQQDQQTSLEADRLTGPPFVSGVTCGPTPDLHGYVRNDGDGQISKPNDLAALILPLVRTLLVYEQEQDHLTFRQAFTRFTNCLPQFTKLQSLTYLTVSSQTSAHGLRFVPEAALHYCPNLQTFRMLRQLVKVEGTQKPLELVTQPTMDRPPLASSLRTLEIRHPNFVLPVPVLKIIAEQMTCLTSLHLSQLTFEVLDHKNNQQWEEPDSIVGDEHIQNFGDDEVFGEGSAYGGSDRFQPDQQEDTGVHQNFLKYSNLSVLASAKRLRYLALGVCSYKHTEKRHYTRGDGSGQEYDVDCEFVPEIDLVPLLERGPPSLQELHIKEGRPCGGVLPDESVNALIKHETLRTVSFCNVQVSCQQALLLSGMCSAQHAGTTMEGGSSSNACSSTSDQGKYIKGKMKQEEHAGVNFSGQYRISIKNKAGDTMSMDRSSLMQTNKQLKVSLSSNTHQAALAASLLLHITSCSSVPINSNTTTSLPADHLATHPHQYNKRQSASGTSSKSGHQYNVGPSARGCVGVPVLNEECVLEMRSVGCVMLSIITECIRLLQQCSASTLARYGYKPSHSTINKPTHSPTHKSQDASQNGLNSFLDVANFLPDAVRHEWAQYQHEFSRVSIQEAHAKLQETKQYWQENKSQKQKQQSSSQQQQQQQQQYQQSSSSQQQSQSQNYSQNSDRGCLGESSGTCSKRGREVSGVSVGWDVSQVMECCKLLDALHEAVSELLLTTRRSVEHCSIQSTTPLTGAKPMHKPFTNTYAINCNLVRGWHHDFMSTWFHVKHQPPVNLLTLCQRINHTVRHELLYMQRYFVLPKLLVENDMVSEQHEQNSVLWLKLQESCGGYTKPGRGAVEKQGSAFGLGRGENYWRDCLFTSRWRDATLAQMTGQQSDYHANIDADIDALVEEEYVCHHERSRVVVPYSSVENAFQDDDDDDDYNDDDYFGVNEDYIDYEDYYMDNDGNYIDDFDHEADYDDFDSDSHQL